MIGKVGGMADSHGRQHLSARHRNRLELLPSRRTFDVPTRQDQDQALGFPFELKDVTDYGCVACW